MPALRKGRPVDGVLLLDKPSGMTSNHALQAAKRLFRAQKAGHTGSLDPMATGVLPICFGEATKFSQYLLDSDKGYHATVQLGRLTSTGDAEGEVLEEQDASFLCLQDVKSVLGQFLGQVNQIPPMYSAIKIQGQPLYKLARQGIDIKRESRQITIYQLEMKDFRPGPLAELDIEVFCSKGTYIRTLGMDIGKALGLGANLNRLVRVAAGEFTLEKCHNLEYLAQRLQEAGEHSPDCLDELLLPAYVSAQHLPWLEVDAATGYHVALGQSQALADPAQTGWVRIRCEGRFLGVGEILPGGRLQPRRLVTQPGNQSTTR